MKLYQEKRRNKALLYSWPVVFVMFVLVLGLSYALWGVAQSERVAREKKKEAMAERDATRERKEELEALVNKLNTPRGIEEEIREKFSVAKPGERVVIVVDRETTTSTKEDDGIWQRIKNFFNI